MLFMSWSFRSGTGIVNVGLLAPALAHLVIDSAVAIQQVDRAGINVVIDLAADPALAAWRLGTVTGAHLLGHDGVDERPHAVRVVDLPIGTEQVEVVGRSKADGARRARRGDRSVLLVLDAASPSRRSSGGREGAPEQSPDGE